MHLVGVREVRLGLLTEGPRRLESVDPRSDEQIGGKRDEQKDDQDAPGRLEGAGAVPDEPDAPDCHREHHDANKDTGGDGPVAKDGREQVFLLLGILQELRSKFWEEWRCNRDRCSQHRPDHKGGIEQPGEPLFPAKSVARARGKIPADDQSDGRGHGHQVPLSLARDDREKQESPDQPEEHKLNLRVPLVFSYAEEGCGRRSEKQNERDQVESGNGNLRPMEAEITLAEKHGNRRRVQE